jgi:hypothetical protein
MASDGHAPTPHIELEERNSNPPTCHGTPQEKPNSTSMADNISKAAEPKGAESDGTGPVGQISDPQHDDDDVENPNRPKGFSFAIVYTCILFGDFFTGYVSFLILD